MSHLAEILANAVNLGISLAILLVLILILVALRRQGRTVSVARLFLKQQDSARATVLVVAGLLVFIVSNVFELYGDIFHIDWTVNEVIETASLVLILAGTAWFHAVLRVSAKHLVTVRRAESEAP